MGAADDGGRPRSPSSDLGGLAGASRAAVRDGGEPGMSIVSMTKVAFSRRSDTAAAAPAGFRDIDTAAHGQGAPSDAITNAMGAVVAYFPTEGNVLYTAIVAAIAAPDVKSLAGQWGAFWF